MFLFFIFAISDPIHDVSPFSKIWLIFSTFSARRCSVNCPGELSELIFQAIYSFRSSYKYSIEPYFAAWRPEKLIAQALDNLRPNKVLLLRSSIRLTHVCTSLALTICMICIRPTFPYELRLSRDRWMTQISAKEVLIISLSFSLLFSILVFFFIFIISLFICCYMRNMV